jgi:hypothetical protein
MHGSSTLPPNVLSFSESLGDMMCIIQCEMRLTMACMGQYKEDMAWGVLKTSFMGIHGLVFIWAAMRELYTFHSTAVVNIDGFFDIYCQAL